MDAFKFFFTLMISIIFIMSADSIEQTADANLQGFDEEMCLKLICSCIQSYNLAKNYKPDELPGYDPPVEFEIKIDGKKEKLGLIYLSKDKTDIIISFRGTVTWIDKNEDFEIEQVAYYQKDVDVSGLKVEKGFYDFYKAAKQSVMPLLEEIDGDRSCRIFIAGHSLGASIALLFSLYLSYNGIYDEDDIHVYTFAGPRTGNSIFSSTYNAKIKNIFRIVNSEDAVPCLPPENIFGEQYDHVKGLYIINFYPDQIKELIKQCHSSLNYYRALELSFGRKYDCNCPIISGNDIIITGKTFGYSGNYFELTKKYRELRNKINFRNKNGRSSDK